MIVQEEEAAFEFDLPPEPNISEKREGTVEDATPVTHLGELAFEAHIYSAEAAYAIRNWPGQVCKSRKQLEDLIGNLAEAAPGCVRMLEVCDDAFFAEKALLFAAKEESGLHGGSVHAAVREEGTVTVCADGARAYGEIPFGPCDELYFLAVDARQVSVHDKVTAVYKERDWAAYALGNEGVRVAAAGTVGRVNIRTLKEWDYDSYHTIVNHDRLGTKIFRSQTELDAWLEAVDTRAVVDLPDEGQLLAEKIRSLHINFETAGLVLCFASGTPKYLGAAVDGDTVRLGCRRGGGGCIPDENAYIVLQPVSLEELGGASRVECRIV
ncbi:MAG: hypothetical protein HFE86_03300 [Clostridiales bacterium]|nr:hypothetical protein [Clostridiales bacterium]